MRRNPADWRRALPVLMFGALTAGVWCARAHAAEAQSTQETGGEPRARPSAPAADDASQESGWLDRWSQWKTHVQDTAGTSVNLWIDTQYQTTLHGPAATRSRGVFWWNLNVTQELWTGGKLIVNARGGSGNGLDPLIGDRCNTNWMAGEPRPAYVSDVYLEQKLLDGTLTLALGKFDVTDYFDRNEIASWNFLSYSLARNPTVPFAYHAAAVVARYEPCEWFYVQASVADAQGSATESGLNTAFRHDEPFVRLCELGFRPRLGGRPGNYRFIVWQDPRTIARIDGRGTRHGDTGFGLNFDQQITDRLGIFARYGHTSRKVRATEHFWSLGAKWVGPIPWREEDELVVGLAQHVMGRDYRRANRSARAETLVEAYYKIRATERLSILPGLQVIHNPGADRRAGASVISVLRVQLSF